MSAGTPREATLSGGTGWGPRGSGLVLLISTNDGRDGVCRWDPDTGRPLGAPLVDHGISVKCVAAQALPDGTTMTASAGDDGSRAFSARSRISPGGSRSSNVYWDAAGPPT